MAELLFWFAVLLLVYVYAGFSILVILVAHARNRSVRTAAITPSATLVIAAYNEEDGIRSRLDNALALDYPRERLEIIIASDGSTDRTVDICRQYAPLGVRTFDLPRRGKIHALIHAVNRAHGDIVVFSDANSIFAPDALRKLARNFADPQVGGVAGATRYAVEANSDATSSGETLYWSYDSWLKELESRTGSVVSAHGQIYAIRRELFEAPTNFAVTDDFALSTGVIARGRRLVYEPAAVSFEYAADAAEREFRRKVRLMTRGLRGVLLRKNLLNPMRFGFYSIVLFSHKVLRRIVPIFLMVLFGVTLGLAWTHWFYAATAAGQMLFYVLALAGFALRHSKIGRSKLFYIPFFYCMANAAALIALINVARGRRLELWQPQRGPAGLQQ